MGSEAYPDPQQTTGSLSVIAADDNDLGARLLGMFLQRLGHRPLTVASGEQLLEQLSAGTFDLALLDLEMPDKDGYQTLHELRSRQPRLPAIAITGHCGEAHRQRCLEAGFDGYLGKPLRLGDLDAEIRRVMLQCGAATGALGSALDGLARQMDIDERTLAVRLEAFLVSAGEHGQQLLLAIENRDENAIAAQAHQLSAPLRALARHRLAAAAAGIASAALAGDWARVENSAPLFKTELLAFCEDAAAWLQKHS